MDPLIVLTSQLNPIWNYFDAKELQAGIVGYWREYCRKFTAGDVPSPGFPMSVHRPSCNDMVVHDSVLVRLGEERPSADQVETGRWVASATDPMDSLILPVGGHPQAVSEPSVLSPSDRRVIADVRKLKFANNSFNKWKCALLDCERPELKAPTD
ncbi:hypothetical protein SERLA73DRAFT_69417 [Serpula lacrymans var. lacrymans S7.3]|uniref:Uncharacterized protein n=2 Tax=Serpula lacrymans var. lacrymans TaxID=341189 RepID=F8PKA7_SERL3|nr:uncharacterized protein SERLADRAFT_433359 [Serpula lacrymans var. lacrymans S7.9]EGO03561.1 hypothetical protein SERLA73DRAFT_69417 [Serpula lacrymans var. lacrymans S7.3]EGO29370.1 hypothetical protein SERLADRAFT_433359 [Serpula lacrymans var. lacrymans S7.9]